MSESNDPQHFKGLSLIDTKPRDSFFERRQVLRLHLTTEQFRIAQSNFIFPILDLSTQGMGLWIDEYKSSENFVIGQKIDGVLNFGGEKHMAQCVIRNMSSGRMGCEFVSLSSDLYAALEAQTDPGVLGSAFKKIPSASLDTIWFHGSLGTELLFFPHLLKQQQSAETLTQKALEAVHLYALFGYVHWHFEKGLISGSSLPAQQRGERRGIFRLETLILKPDLVLDFKKLELAKKLIVGSNLDIDLRKICLKIFDISS